MAIVKLVAASTAGGKQSCGGMVETCPYLSFLHVERDGATFTGYLHRQDGVTAVVVRDDLNWLVQHCCDTISRTLAQTASEGDTSIRSTSLGTPCSLGLSSAPSGHAQCARDSSPLEFAILELG